VSVVTESCFNPSSDPDDHYHSYPAGFNFAITDCFPTGPQCHFLFRESHSGGALVKEAVAIWTTALPVVALVPAGNPQEDARTLEPSK